MKKQGKLHILNLMVMLSMMLGFATGPVSAAPAQSETDAVQNYVSTDVPKAVPDGNATGIDSVINIADVYSIFDVNVTLSINHTWDSDLDIYLDHPDGTRVELSTDNGSSGDNYVNTVLDDEATTLVTAGVAPFTGSYKPEGLLSALDGKPVNGAWKLHVADDTSYDTGTITAWSLQITPEPPVVLTPATQSGATCQGANFVYHQTITNKAGAAETYNLAASGNAWPTVINPTSVTLANGASTSITVTVTIPGYAFDGDVDHATITATGVGDPTRTGSAAVHTTAGSKWMPVGNTSSAPKQWAAFAPLPYVPGPPMSGMLYFGGRDASGSATNTLQGYFIMGGAGAWEIGPPAAVAAYGGVAGSHYYSPTLSVAYYAPGFQNGMVALNSFYAFNWGTPSGWQTLPNRPAARGLGAGGATSDGKFIWAGGSPNSGFLPDTDVYVYSGGLAGTWITGTALTGVAFTAPGYAVVGDKLYVGGNYFGSNLFYAYDVSDDAWTQLANLPAAAGKVSPLFINDGDDIYLIGGGFSPSTPQATTWRYDITANTWEPFAPINKATLGNAGGLLNGALYTFGGGTGSAFSPAPHEFTIPDCAAVTSATLSGYVTNGVTGDPIEGALVKAVGAGTLSPATLAGFTPMETDASIQGAGTTPQALTDETGYYELTLFTPASYDVTASFGAFEPKTEAVDVDGDTDQDFILGPADANPSPTSFTATVPWASTKVMTMTLANDGLSALNFQLTESNGGFIPLGTFEALGKQANSETKDTRALSLYNGKGEPKPTRPMSSYRYIAPNASPNAPSIIVYADDDMHTPTAQELALQQLGLSYTFYGYDGAGANLDAFLADLTGGTWDFVILAEDSWARVAADDFDAVNAHINGGGKAIVYCWAIGYDATHSGHALWTNMGASYASWLTSLTPGLSWWEPSHPLFNMPESVPPFTDLTDLGYTAYGAKMNPVTTLNAIGEALGGFAPAAASGQGGVIIREDGATIYKGVTENVNDADLDADSKWDPQEWWTNAIQGVLFGFGGGDIPWLSESPITGTLAAETADIIDITFDATGVEDYGTYTGTLSLLSNDPATPKIDMPVTMIVTANPLASKLQGTVTTDRPGGALEGATVDITNATPWSVSLTTDADGYYETLIPPGEVGKVFTIDISAPDYQTKVQTETVTAPGPVIHDVKLVYDGPQIAVAPLSFEKTVLWGESVTDVLNISNSGAAALNFNIGLGPLPLTDFEGAFPPPGWTVIDNGGCDVWQRSDYYGRSNYTGGSGYAADADSDACGDAMDTELWTPAFSLVGINNAQLRFKSDFNDFLNSDDGYVDVSTDGGDTWTNVLHYDKMDYSARTETISLADFAGEANVIVRFHYVAPYWDYWWEVDDVQVSVPGTPWLSWTPDTGVVAIDGNQDVDLTADSIYTPGPGDYQLTLFVEHNDALTPPASVPFLLHVLPNPDQGYLEGTVLGNRTPAGDNLPLEGASVVVENPMLTTYNLTTDAAGHYEVYVLPALTGNYDLTISYPDYTTYFTTPVTIGMGESVVRDTTLILDSANLVAAPESIAETVPWGGTATVTVTIGNPLPATQMLHVNIVEMAPSFTPLVKDTVQVTLPAINANRVQTSQAASFAPAKAHSAITRDVTIDKLALGKIKVLIVSSDWPAAGDIGGLDLVLGAYPDLQVDIYPLDVLPTLPEMLPYQVVIVGSQYTWESTYDHHQLGNVFADYVDAGGKVIQLFGTMHGSPSGTYYWALGGRWQAEAYSPLTYSTAYSLYQTRSLGVHMAGHPLLDGVTSITDYFVYGNDLAFRPDAEAVAYYDNGVPYLAAYPGKVVAINECLTNGADWSGDIPTLLHNAVMFLAGGDIPWLSETVTSFDNNIDEWDVTDVALDASVPEVDQPGTYSAWLWLDNNDLLQNGAYIPVNMTVQADPTMGHLHGTVTLNRHVDGEGIPAANVPVVLQGPGGAVTLLTNASGQYSRYYPAADLPAAITVTVSRSGYQTVTGAVTLTDAQQLQHDVELEMIAPWIDAAPAALEVNLISGQQTTEQVTLDNFGLTDLEFRFLEFPPTATMPTAAGLSGMLAPVNLDTSAQQIDPLVTGQLDRNGKADFWVRLRQSANLSASTGLSNKAARGAYVYNSMRSVAESSQKGIVAYLKSRGLEYKSHWIVNSVLVYGASEADLRALAAMPEVLEIKGRFVAELHGNTNAGFQPYISSTAASSVFPAASLSTYNPLGNLWNMVAAGPQAEINWSGTAWGISFIGADQAWETYGFRGEGIVVGNIDTGVQWDHPALMNQFRGWDGATAEGNYNWYAPTTAAQGACDDADILPCDWGGHGSHTMGTMVGDDGVEGSAGHRTGVAPNAKWIACMGCDTPPNQCSDEALTTCGEWIVAPTDLDGNNPDPSKAPDVINNSWGGGGGDDWYQAYVQAWVAAGIFPAFSAGNAGPACGSAGSPGDYPESFASGMVDSSGVIDSGSSRGPGVFPGADIKPDLAAPGVAVCSTVPDDSYTCGYTGTSMASPHTAGAVALIWSANPNLRLDIDATKQLLRDTANPNVPDEGNCGAPTKLNALVPNYTYGYGYLDVLKAMQESIVYDISWLSEDPETGVVAPDGTQLVDVTFDATGLSTGTYTGTLRIMHNDPLTGKMDIPVTLHVVEYEPLLTPETASASGNPGAVVTYTLTVENNGSTADTFDVDYSGVWPGVLSTRSVGPLDPGEQGTFTVRVTIPAAAFSGDKDIATVTATSQGDDTKTDTSTLTTTVAQQPVVVQVTKTAAKNQVIPGQDIVYTIQVTNNSHDPVNVVLTDTIPANTVYKIGSVTGGLAFSDPPANQVSWTGQIAPGASKTFSFAVTTLSTPAGTTVANTVYVKIGSQNLQASVNVLVDYLYIFLPLIQKLH